MRHRRLLATLAALGFALALGCSTMEPGDLDSDARESLGTLSPRVERTPPDLAALDEVVAIYASHQRFADADAVIRGVLERSALETGGLARVAELSGTLANQAERAMRDDPKAVPDAEVKALAARAHALIALVRFRAQRDRGPVTADVRRVDGGAVRLRDVMLECWSNDYEPDGSVGGPLTVAYFGDRLRVTSGSGAAATDGEALLGEIAQLTIDRDPMGRSRVRIEPHPWSRQTRPCESCTLLDACSLVGDGPPAGGLAHVELRDVRAAAFGWEPGP